MKVPLFDLRVDHAETRSHLLSNFKKVLNHGKLFSGPEILEFESKIAKLCSSTYAIGVSSGSSALYLALKASGIKNGDEVITTPLTWIITVNAIVSCGATPVFADVNEDFNIDPASIEKLITKNTKAIVPVHYAGHMCDMKVITSIAKKYSLLIVEDAAQAFGASLDKKMAGTYSSAGAFSMNPMKNLGGYGEAGAVVTDNKEIYEKLLLLRHAGTIKTEEGYTNNCTETSLNHKMDTINAAFLLVALNTFSAKMRIREKVATVLNKKLDRFVKIPVKGKNEVHGRYVYPIKVEKRDELMLFLKSKQIETKILNKPLACDAPIYKKFKTTPVPKSEQLLSQNLIIPSHEKLTQEQLDYIGDCFEEFFTKYL